MLLLLLAACPAGPDSSSTCPTHPCEDEAIIHMIGPNGPTIATGSVQPEDSARFEFDCRERAGAGWTCDDDGTLHIPTRAPSLHIEAYSTDANAHASSALVLTWVGLGTDQCPTDCDAAEVTVTLDPTDTACFKADSDTGGCK
ncbi:MAG: hypothetical protein EXR69_09390 [Myxococcales bacterium]|nr:hypothetical protein [Myxococcales bacterium]